MTDSTSDPGSSVRGGFWRRVFAVLVDMMLVTFIVAIIGVPLYEPTGGAVRVGNTVFNATHCSSTTLNRPDVQLPADFKPTGAAICVRTFFGQEHDRILLIQQVTRSGTVIHSRTISQPVDAQDRVVRVFYLDYLTLLLIVIYLFICEWRFGTTLGKSILRLHVRSLGGAPMTRSQAAIRSLARLLWFAPLLVFILLAIVLAPGQFTTLVSDNLFTILAVGLGWLLVFFLNFVLTVRRRILPWHDRWAGTEVVRNALTASATQAPVTPAGPSSAPSG
jgi:uncharacterized RDD family membrane protein YckC